MFQAGAKGQAMVETTIALLFLLACFFAVFQYADNLRAKLLCEYAAGRCARAATIGLNDYMIEKTAHISTMAAAGECHTQNDQGEDIGYQSWMARAPDYLQCEYTAQAQQVLDFEYWRNGRTTATATRSGAKIVATVQQNRPQFFNLAKYLSGTLPDEEHPDEAHITGTSEIEAHYPDWLQ